MNSFVKSYSASFGVEPMINTYLVTTAGSALVATLCDASTPRRGRFLVIKKVDSGAGSVVITPVNSQTIDGASTKTLNIQGQSVVLERDGGNWQVSGEWNSILNRVNTWSASNGFAAITASLATVTTSPAQSVTATTRSIYGKINTASGSVALVGNNFCGVRGEANVNTGSTLASGYLYGAQGKLVVVGTMASANDCSAALVGQLDLSTATAISGQTGTIAALLLDAGATSAVAMSAVVNMVRILNTTTKLVNSIFSIAADANYFFETATTGNGQQNYIVGTAKASAWTKSLKIKIDGTDHYIPINTAAS